MSEEVEWTKCTTCGLRHRTSASGCPKCAGGTPPARVARDGGSDAGNRPEGSPVPGHRNMFVGGGWVLLGTTLTVLSLVLSDGESVSLVWGMILVGIVQFGIGLVQNLRQ